MPRRHIETRNIVFHIGTVASGSLRMMKTEISTNGEAPIEAREHRRATITQDHKRTGSAHLDEPSSRSGEEKKRSLFRRPGVIVVATAESSRASVQADEAAVEQAELNLGHSKIKAPIDGYVTKEAVATGDYVQVGQALMSLVPPRVWVIANFKETQLRNMRPRQPVQIKIDAYPDQPLHGHIDSIQAGSGAAFSLLPPENATGNYVKVVQRVPVKIMLDEEQQMQRVLGPGMSVVPTAAMDHGNEAAFVIAIIAVVLAAGVIFWAALWVGRGRRGQA